MLGFFLFCFCLMFCFCLVYGVGNVKFWGGIIREIHTLSNFPGLLLQAWQSSCRVTKVTLDRRLNLSQSSSRLSSESCSSFSSSPCSSTDSPPWFTSSPPPRCRRRILGTRLRTSISLASSTWPMTSCAILFLRKSDQGQTRVAQLPTAEFTRMTTLLQKHLTITSSNS